MFGDGDEGVDLGCVGRFLFVVVFGGVVVFERFVLRGDGVRDVCVVDVGE